MKVLTVWQPWASLIAVGAKPYEFRGSRPPRSFIGQRIAIHAGKRKLIAHEVFELLHLVETEPWRCGLRGEVAAVFLKSALAQPALVPLGSILCTAVLGEPRDGWDIAAEFGARVNDSDRDDRANFGWPLRDIEMVMPPLEHRGRQGWSDWWPS